MKMNSLTCKKSIHSFLLASIAFVSQNGLAQEESPQKLRILSSRSVVVERAGQSNSRNEVDEANPNNQKAIHPDGFRVAPKNPYVTNSPALARPTNSKTVTVKTPEPVRPIRSPIAVKNPESQEARREAAIKRVRGAVVNIQSPESAGIPREQLQDNPTNPSALPIIKTKPDSLKHNSASTLDPMSPSAGATLVTRDPMASEVTRDGDFFYFTGTINGTAVRFRINNDVSGIKIPYKTATGANVITENLISTLSRQEIITPVSTITFGAYPVRSAMAKIYNAPADQVIDVGPDVLVNFQVKTINGRRILLSK